MNRVVPLGRLLTPEEAGLYGSAAAALRQATLEAASRRAANAAELHEARATAMEAAEAEGRRRAAVQEAAAAARIAQRLAALESEVAAAIADGVARIIGAIDVANAVAAAARQALDEIGARQGVIVHVHPSTADAVRRALPDLRVVADPALPGDGCTLETPGGVIRAGLSDQLAALREALCR